MAHTDAQIATQSYHASNKVPSTTIADDHIGHTPQPKGSEWEGLVNTGASGVPYYTPAANPSSGTVIPVGDVALPKLFEPWKLRSVEFKNRIVASSMCQYSAPTGTGMPNDWHLVHQGQYAIRGVSLIMTEATAVTSDGLISPEDLGIWSDEHIPAYKRIVDFIHSQGGKAGIQIAHSGRKGSTLAPWLSDGLISPVTNPKIKESANVPAPLGGFEIRAPSAVAFNAQHATPKEMSLADIEEIKEAFVKAAERCLAAGYDVLEVHGAHGYLIHQFVSPVSNKRTDKYGGSLENRLRFALEIVEAVRKVWPAEKPLFYRVSATDWHEDGEGGPDNYTSWGPKQTGILAEKLKAAGVDLIDVSSGGVYAGQQISIGPGYQVPFAEGLKKNPALSGLLVSSVGLITSPKQAEEILQKGQADVVMLARELLRNADFVTQAANELDVVVSVPVQYQRAHTRMFKKLHEKA